MITSITDGTQHTSIQHQTWLDALENHIKMSRQKGAKKLSKLILRAAIIHHENEGKTDQSHLPGSPIILVWMLAKADEVLTNLRELEGNDATVQVDYSMLQKTDACYWKARRHLFNFLRKALRNETESDDVCSQVYLALRSHVEYLFLVDQELAEDFADNEDQIRGWLFITARNLCFGFRKAKRIESTIDNLDAAIELELTNDLPKHHTFDFDDVRPHFNKCSLREQEVVGMLAEGDSTAEVAHHYGVNRTTIWRIQKGIKVRIAEAMRQREFFRHMD